MLFIGVLGCTSAEVEAYIRFCALLLFMPYSRRGGERACVKCELAPDASGVETLNPSAVSEPLELL